MRVHFVGPLTLQLKQFTLNILTGVGYWFELILAVLWLGANFFSMESPFIFMGWIKEI